MSSPKHIGPPLLKDRLLMFVEQVPGVDHVEEVELCVDGDGGLHPGIVGRRALLDGELLKCESDVKLNYFSRIRNVYSPN